MDIVLYFNYFIFGLVLIWLLFYATAPEPIIYEFSKNFENNNFCANHNTETY